METINTESQAKRRTQEIIVEGKTYNLALTLNIIDEIQTRYGSLDELCKIITDPKELRELILLYMNDAVARYNRGKTEEEKRPIFTAEEIGLIVDVDNVKEFERAILVTFGINLPQGKKSDEDTEIKNA